MIFHRIHWRNPQAITNRAVRGAAPALDHDVVFATEIDDVPDNQEIAGKLEFYDKRQFLFELTFHFRANRSVTLLRAEPNDGPQKGIHRMTGWHWIFGKFVPEIFERERESLSQARRVFNCFRQIRENRSHLSIALQMAFGVLGQQFSGSIQMSVLADASENIQYFASVELRVFHSVCCDER